MSSSMLVYAMVYGLAIWTLLQFQTKLLIKYCKFMMNHLLLCFCSVADPAEGELGGREPTLAGPDPEPDAAEPNPARSDHREQGLVPCGAETIYVRDICFVYAA